MRGGGGGDPSGLTLGLAPIGPVDLCMEKKLNLKMSASVRVCPRPSARPRPSASADYIKPSPVKLSMYDATIHASFRCCYFTC